MRRRAGQGSPFRAVVLVLFGIGTCPQSSLDCSYDVVATTKILPRPHIPGIKIHEGPDVLGTVGLKTVSAM